MSAPPPQPLTPATERFTQALFDCVDVALTGGKAINLGRLFRAGFPVPDGFVVTTRAYRYAHTAPGVPGGNGNSNGNGAANAPLPPEVAEQVRAAYAALGGGPVAVRSSATAEDAAAASMAGQYETFLNVEGEAALLEAVRGCWRSLDTPRTRAYLHEHGIDPADVAMAVVVQRLVPADVAGVLFTANPRTGARREMLLEASWGLGESVVSGRVQPDVLRLEGDTGRVLAATIAEKRTQIAAGAGGETEVDEHRRRKPCLRGADVQRLWKLGRRAADHFGSPQDLEWAIGGGPARELFLLQSRPITTLEEAEAYEEVLRSARARLREKLSAGRGPWVLHNLAETLPHPTPLTWSVVGRFMTGAGGFGAMYRRAGFEPSPASCREGFLERIAGKVYMDAAMAPEMFFEGFPFRYDLDRLRRDPGASQAPPDVPAGSARARLAAGRRMGAVTRTLRSLEGGFDAELAEKIIPEFLAACREERSRDLGAMSNEELIETWHRRERMVLDEFAPQSLLPGLIEAMALGDLQALLEEHFWDEDGEELARLLSSGGPPDCTVISDAELYEVAQGKRPVGDWIAAHGHRAAGEFDLAAPRWSEQSNKVTELAGRLKGGADPSVRHHEQGRRVEERLSQLRSRLDSSDATELDRRVALVRRYVVFRENGKDALMFGYALLRDVALEAGRRLEVGDDVFFLTREDLFDALRVGFAPLHLIAQRKTAHKAEGRVSVPRVIGADDVETLGEPPKAADLDANAYKVFALSSGVASGPARVVRSPTEAGEMGRGYILVCPSTDPSWTPLFVNAAGLVLECGGTLSHGAVVAREMGLPAVVLPDATRLLRDGEPIRVDGRGGSVSRDDGTGDADQAPLPADAPPDENDVHVPRALVPPPPGRRERMANRVAWIAAGVWGVYLLFALLLMPDRWLYDPSLAVLDRVLWPLVRSAGKPATVAVVAGGLALLTMLIQRLWTDNGRLLEAKRRAARLNKEACKFPQGSPRQVALSRLAAPVQWRVFAAALAPLALVLGPAVMTFLWFPLRVDPASWNPPPGTAVTVTAMVDVNRETESTVHLQLGQGLVLDRSPSPQEVTVPSYRRVLKKLLAEWRKPSRVPDEPWELKAAAEAVREETVADLEAFLRAGVPPKGVTWGVKPASDKAAGRFTVEVVGDDGRALRVPIVIGDVTPPDVKDMSGDGRTVVKSVTVNYPPPATKPVFWAPFGWLRSAPPSLHLSRLAAWDAGWLGVYLAAYLPVMFLCRKVLRVA